jgi:hypothetical protein
MASYCGTNYGFGLASAMYVLSNLQKQKTKEKIDDDGKENGMVITATTTVIMLSTMSIVVFVSTMGLIVVNAVAATTEMLATVAAVAVIDLRPNFHTAFTPAIRSRKSRDPKHHDHKTITTMAKAATTSNSVRYISSGSSSGCANSNNNNIVNNCYVMMGRM